MTVRYGHTWWGRAWVEALEQRSGVDARRLARGRTYAGQDRVGSVAVEPGIVAASVRGSRRLDYRTHLDLRTFDDDGWHRLLGVVAGRAGHVAALLDGDVEPGLVEDAHEAGVELLPSPGDLKPRCSCPDDRSPCKHAAALAYVVAEMIDDDPFVLFHLRGRPRPALLDELRAARRAATADPAGPGGATGASEDIELSTGTGPDPGEAAREAWSRDRTPLPALPELPAAPGRPAAWPDDPPPDAPFDTPGLLALAADAARRAWEQLREDGDSGLGLTAAADLTRREVSAPDSDLPSVVTASGSSAADREARAVAWRHGGAAALAVVDEPPWRPPVATMAAGRAAAEAAGVPTAALTVHQNRITAPGFQLRLAHDGSWWRFEKRRGRWQVAAAPAPTADDLVD